MDVNVHHDEQQTMPLTESQVETIIDRYVGRVAIRAWSLLITNAVIIVGLMFTAYGWKKDTDALIVKLSDQAKVIDPLTTRVIALESASKTREMRDGQFTDTLKEMGARITVMSEQSNRVVESQAVIRTQLGYIQQENQKK